MPIPTTPMPTTPIPTTPIPTTPIPTTPIPTTPMPDGLCGNWSSYSYSGNQFGPVSISLTSIDSNGTKNYYINGGTVWHNNLRYLTIDSNLNASLPKQNVYNFGIVTNDGNRAVKIGDRSVIFRR
jgi:hypothetical protein